MRKLHPFRFALIAASIVLSSVFCHAQAALAGDWEGTLSVGGNEAHIVWHVMVAADGTVTSTFDNKDEGVLGIKVKEMSLKDSKLTLTVDDQVEVNGSAVNIRGAFEGAVSADGNAVTGTWTQSDPEPEPPMELQLKRTGAPAAPVPAPKS